MGFEIERKFLVKNESYKNLAEPEAETYHQGFLSTNKERIVRVRIGKDSAWLTIKGMSKGAIRKEFEYEIPIDDAEFILNEICKKPTILKKRYRIPMEAFIWEVDEFLNDNKGLVIAEIELNSEDEKFDIPDWIGYEVTGDKKYYNAYLVKHPYTSWN